MSTVMRCKLKLHGKGDTPDSFGVQFGAVWEGSSEQQAVSENAIFGKYTPYAEFKANICNPNVHANLEVGKEYYVDFIPVES